jgi:hypothetical protein
MGEGVLEPGEVVIWWLIFRYVGFVGFVLLLAGSLISSLVINTRPACPLGVTARNGGGTAPGRWQLAGPQGAGAATAGAQATPATDAAASHQLSRTSTLYPPALRSHGGPT